MKKVFILRVMAGLLFSLGVFISCQKESVENLNPDLILFSIQSVENDKINKLRNNMNCCDITRGEIDIQENIDSIKIFLRGYEDCDTLINPQGTQFSGSITKISPYNSVPPQNFRLVRGNGNWHLVVSKDKLECGERYKYSLSLDIPGCEERITYEGEFIYDCDPTCDCTFEFADSDVCGPYGLYVNNDCNLPFSYNWTLPDGTNSNDITIPARMNGTYTVTITGNGCEQTISIEIEDCEPVPPPSDCCNVIPTLVVDQLDCGSVRLTVPELENCEIPSGLFWFWYTAPGNDNSSISTKTSLNTIVIDNLNKCWNYVFSVGVPSSGCDNKIPHPPEVDFDFEDCGC